MAENSNIEWCDHTFNPWRGCTKVSAGCAHCYAETLSKRNPKLLGEWGKGKPRVLASDEMWRQPLKWNSRAGRQRLINGQLLTQWGTTETAGQPDSRVINIESPDGFDGTMTVKEWNDLPLPRPRVFCASLADWLDDEVPIEWFKRLLKLIHETPNIDWLLLTKRPQNWRSRLEGMDHDIIFDTGDFVASEWLEGRPPANVWLGTSVEDQLVADARIPALLKIPAKVRFLSCEPLLGPVVFAEEWLGSEAWRDAVGSENYWINWVIAGGESGPNARTMDAEWARSLRDQCSESEVPFLFKQWGGTNKKASGRLLDGRTWNEFPKLLLPSSTACKEPLA